MSIKAGWWDASLILWDFSRSNEHCTYLSTTKAIYFSHFVFAMSAFQKQLCLELFCKNSVLKNSPKLTGVSSGTDVFCEFCKSLKNTFFFTEHLQWLLLAFAPIEISYLNTVCNKSTSEAWICLIFFYGGEWLSKRLYFHKYFPQNNLFLH